MPHRKVVRVAALAVVPVVAAAQDEAALKRFFEGKRVIVKMEMPASKDGGDVQFGRPEAIDFGLAPIRALSAYTAWRSVRATPSRSPTSK